MRRRDFVTLLGGAAVAWPLAGQAQQPERMRRIGVLMNLAADDPQSTARVTAFAQGLQELGWTISRNVRIDYRWAAGDAEHYRRYAAELTALAPDVIVASGGTSLRNLQRASRTIPIVFVGVTDPVGGGMIASLARPGGNATGFTNFEYGISAKWLQLLKEVAPRILRVSVIREPTVAGGGQFGAIQSVAPSFGVELSPIDVREPAEIEHTLMAFARGSNGALVVTNSALATIHRELIITLAARHKLPAVYPARFFAATGGLISYGVDGLYQWRQAASYVDRILKGEKPANLPAQSPTRFELVINLKTARALGLDVPPMLQAIADEVIE